MPSFQIVIIGAGPGGYVAAFKAADQGMTVTLIDTDTQPGGVCLNRGCIPSKALLHAARILNDAKDADAIGIGFSAPNIDIDKLRAWKDGVVAKLTGGLGQLAKARKITLIQGKAKFVNAKTLEITRPDGTTQTLTCEKVILATGSRPVELAFMPKSARVWDSTAALALPRIPTSLLVVGGGYIGLELGTAYAGLGSKVSIVEALPALLPALDKDVADILMRRLKKTFTSIMTGTKITHATETPAGITVTLIDAKGKEWQETYDQILVCIGRKPNSDDLGLDKTSVIVTDKGFIEVDAQRRTAEDHIYAIGDVTGAPQLAHKASAEAKVAIDALGGYDAAFAPKCIPSVMFTDPEVASCGITEQDALTQKIDVTVSKFPWMASGRAMTLTRTDGMTKIMADTHSGKILGVTIIGAGAGELIAEGALAIEAGLKAEDLEQTIHPHPTLSETMMETAEGLFGAMTHILKIKK